ncbi:sulfotransferase 1C2 [Rhipicephalus sanguineus]|uniref:sulfotransferase 1C2 n=1 Tax=Rhipicephalus sanguineus TaxID=34632 RepID=UPI0020C2497A|nr:sulfotransferase 1C2 [Rhipicephalus sanguineus]
MPHDSFTCFGRRSSKDVATVETSQHATLSHAIHASRLECLRKFSLVSFQLVYGDYFDHLLPWYERRGDDNVLFLTYEQMKADTRGQVLKIADFLGKNEHGAELRRDEAVLQNILDACSLDNMRTVYKDMPIDRTKKTPFSAKSSFVEASGASTQDDEVEMHQSPGFIRKGVVGDWRNHFTSEQARRTKEWITRKTEGSDVMTLWKDCGLP